MIQMRTILEVADNSGARRISCIHALGTQVGRVASLGRRHHCERQGGFLRTVTSRKAMWVKAVIVRTRKEYRRKDGTYIRFDDNAAVLVNDQHEPVGTPCSDPSAAN